MDAVASGRRTSPNAQSESFTLNRFLGDEVFTTESPAAFCAASEMPGRTHCRWSFDDFNEVDSSNPSLFIKHFRCYTKVFIIKIFSNLKVKTRNLHTNTNTNAKNIRKTHKMPTILPTTSTHTRTLDYKWIRCKVELWLDTCDKVVLPTCVLYGTYTAVMWCMWALSNYTAGTSACSELEKSRPKNVEVVQIEQILLQV